MGKTKCNSSGLQWDLRMGLDFKVNSNRKNARYYFIFQFSDFASIFSYLAQQ